MKFKLVALVLLALLVLLGTVSCAKKKEPILKIGTNAEYPPFEYKVKDEFMGVDMELAKMISEKLGMKYEIIDMDFDALIPSLMAQKIDMAMSAITITEDRKKVIDFSIPYYFANQAIITREDSEVTIEQEAQLAKFKIGVQNGTTGQLYLDENFVAPGLMDKKNLKKYPTNIEAITDLMNGNLDLVIIDDSAAMGYQKLRPIKTIYTIETGESYGIALPKDSPYKEKLNTALDEILKSDAWVELMSKYL